MRMYLVKEKGNHMKSKVEECIELAESASKITQGFTGKAYEKSWSPATRPSNVD